MGDVDHVEHAERDRHAHADGGVEAAEQKPGDDGVEHQRRREFHYSVSTLAKACPLFRTAPYFRLSWYGVAMSPVLYGAGESTVT